MPTPPQYRFVEAAATGAVAGRRAVVPGVRRSGAAGAGPGSDRRTTSICAWPSLTSRRRAAAPGSPSRTSIPQVDGTAGYGVRGASSTEENNDTTHQSGVYGFRLSWEIDLFGRLRRGQEAAIALALASEQGRRGVLVTLVGDVATNYFLLRELDLQLADRARHPPSERRDRRVLPEPPGRRRVEPSRARSRSRRCAQQTAAAIPEIEHQMGVVENQISLLLGRPPGPVARAGADQSTKPAAADSAGPPASLARTPARRRPGRAGARGGQRRHRCGEVAVLSHDQPDRLSGRRQRRPDVVPGRERRRCGRSARVSSSRSFRPAAFAEISRRRRRGSTRRSPNTRRPRSTAIARSPTRW